MVSFVERLKARCAAVGRKITRVILTHEVGRDGFWLARFLARRGIEVHVMQPSSLPVDRRARRAKTDIIDVEMLLRTLMAWLRGESGAHARARLIERREPKIADKFTLPVASSVVAGGSLMGAF